MIFEIVFLGMNLGTIRMVTCLAPNGREGKLKLCAALERATSSNFSSGECALIIQLS